MKHIYILFLLISSVTLAQESWDDLTGQEKAFFYHQCRRVEILKPELFHLFEFTDSIPYINDTLPDYNYVERQIVNHPLLLELHTDQMGRKSDGLIQDLAVRYAIWELDQVLHYRNSTAEVDKPLKEKLKVFEKYVLEESPQRVIRTLNNGDYVLVKTVQGYYAPSLTVSDKMAAIVNAGYEQIDQMLILNAIMKAQEKYVAARVREMTEILGGNTASQNYLSAVGDGSNWAEIKGGFNTPYTQGLPDEKGLFRFNIKEDFNKEKEITTLKVESVVSKQFNMDSDKETVVHIDVFGYHPERQTTLAIQKGGNSYVLYGKNDHRLVSPDSTYGEGTTYWRLMYRLEHYYIATLKENLYGKRGYEYQINLLEEKIEETRLRIKKTEYRLDELRHTPEGKPKMKKKKIKKKDLGKSDQDGGGHPTSMMSKLDKKKNIEQNRLLQLNGQLGAQKSALKQLKVDMEEAYGKLLKCEKKLDFMRKNIGYIMMEYEEEGGIYTFKDGATFNYATQDFVFPSDRSESTFQIYHISFGKEVFDESIDENFIHLNVSTRNRNDKYSLRRLVRDNGRRGLTVSDSIQIMEIFTYLSEKKNDANLVVKAGGVVGEHEGHFFRDSTEQVVAYNKDSQPNDGLTLYEGRRTTEMNFTVTVYDDEMLPFNFEVYRPIYLKFREKYPNLNEIDFYTGIRAKKAAEDWVKLLKELVPQWVEDGGDRSRIQSKLKRLKVKKVNFHGVERPQKVPDFIP